MVDLPRGAVSRTARLASLPLGYAGRTALGVGKRLGGRSAESVMTEMQQRTAEQLFRTLGELKGGAMKFGQALSIFEGALPEELAAPYREQLTRLQDSAPPMPRAVVHQQLLKEFGPAWRRSLVEFDETPRGRRIHRPGPPRPLVRRHRGRGQDPVPRRRGGAARRPAPDHPARPCLRRPAARHRRPGPGRRADRAGDRGARLRPRGRGPAGLRRRLRRRPALRRPAAGGPRPARHRQRVAAREPPRWRG